MTAAQATFLPETPATVQTPARSLAPKLDQPARFAVMGLLRQAARIYTTTGGTVILEALVAQHLQLHPEARNVVVRYRYPDQGCPNTTMQAAHSKASRMVPGAEVVCCGSALYPGRYLNEQVTVLDDVAAIALANDVVPATH